MVLPQSSVTMSNAFSNWGILSVLVFVVPQNLQNYKSDQDLLLVMVPKRGKFDWIFSAT